MKIPSILDVSLLYVSTGEDKGDDVNFAVGVRGGAGSEVFSALVEFLTPDRCSELVGTPCKVVVFPKLQALDILAVDCLKTAGFDKQGKAMGRALLEKMRSLPSS